MEICVRQNDNQTIKINVDSSDTTDTLKRKIQKKQGIPVNQQFLISTGKELEDNHVLAESEIQKGSILNLIVADDKHVIVKRLVGAPIALEIEWRATILEVKQMIEDLEGIPKEQQVMVVEGKLVGDRHNVNPGQVVHMTHDLKGGDCCPSMKCQLCCCCGPECDCPCVIS